MSRERGEEFAHQIGAMYTETSASENTGKILFDRLDTTRISHGLLVLVAV